MRRRPAVDGRQPYGETLVSRLASGHADAVEAFVDGLGVEVVRLDHKVGRRAAPGLLTFNQCLS
jgi:hypothetical protein